MKFASLTPDVLQIVKHKGTEPPFSSANTDVLKEGTYLCRGCGLGLFRADSQFISSCGWPSFDDEIQGNIRQQLDEDGHRTEILCARCDSHLGHIFHGESITEKNVRYCVNSLAVDFVEQCDVVDSEEAILAAGCFWGVQSQFKQLPGVLKTQVGYTGGSVSYPTYEQVCCKTTGHVEGIRVLFDPTKVDYKAVIRYFFQIHDPGQADGQGLDKGSQYLSRIFYYDDKQRTIAEQMKQQLIAKGKKIVTTLMPVDIFWLAENYHQNYHG